jgi:hypothetical protein
LAVYRSAAAPHEKGLGGMVKWLLDEQLPHAEKVRLVSDNLNTHTISSLYETFPPAEALRLARRLEMHHTPKHGSWRGIAEIELSAMTVQCLGKRHIPSIEKLNRNLLAWHVDRNKNQMGVDWQFTTEDAHINLNRLYPLMQ